jgi:hypothetical protein
MSGITCEQYSINLINGHSFNISKVDSTTGNITLQEFTGNYENCTRISTTDGRMTSLISVDGKKKKGKNSKKKNSEGNDSPKNGKTNSNQNNVSQSPVPPAPATTMDLLSFSPSISPQVGQLPMSTNDLKSYIAMDKVQGKKSLK